MTAKLVSWPAIPRSPSVNRCGLHGQARGGVAEQLVASVLEEHVYQRASVDKGQSVLERKGGSEVPSKGDEQL